MSSIPLNGKLMHVLRVEQNSLFNPPLIPQNSTQTHKQILLKSINFIESNGNKLHKAKQTQQRRYIMPKMSLGQRAIAAM
jgi:hypothetical protein